MPVVVGSPASRSPYDVAEAAAARIARSRVLYEDGHHYVVLMEESVLRYRTADRGAARAAAPPPGRDAARSVSLGIIPFTAQRTVCPLDAFISTTTPRLWWRP